MKLDAQQYELLKQDSRYLPIGDLPSEYLPYDFKELFIRPFEVAELRLLSRAKTLRHIPSFLHALDLVISQPIADISFGDLYYLMMWMKTHSYTKTPYVVEWTCGASYYRHIESDQVIFNDGSNKIEPFVESDYVIEECTASNTEPVTTATLDVVCLPEDLVLEEGLDFPRTSVLLDKDEYQKDPDYAFLVPAAMWLPGTTVESKMLFLEEHEHALDLFQKAELASKSVLHGIKQTCVLSCRHCRTKYPHKLELEPLDFFL